MLSGADSVFDRLELKQSVLKDDHPGVSFTIVRIALAYVHLTHGSFTVYALIHVYESTLPTGENQ